MVKRNAICTVVNLSKYLIIAFHSIFSGFYFSKPYKEKDRRIPLYWFDMRERERERERERDH